MIASPGQGPIRAVIDLNVIVSASIAARGASFAVWLAWLAGEFALLISHGMIVELTGKLLGPRITRRYRISPEAVWSRTDLLRRNSLLVLVPGASVIAVTGDPEDDLVLATARLGQADYLVTYDRRLLALGTYEGTSIVEPTAFLTILRRSRT
jgi:uncharacterized protein